MVAIDPKVDLSELDKPDGFYEMGRVVAETGTPRGVR